MVPCTSGLFGEVLPPTHGNEMLSFWELHVSKQQQHLSNSPMVLCGQLAAVCWGSLLCVLCHVPDQVGTFPMGEGVNKIRVTFSRFV